MLTVAKAEELQKNLQGKLIPEKKARGITNRFILENLRDGFCAGTPTFVFVGEDPAWSVPVLFSQIKDENAEVGEVLIHAIQEVILGFTPPTEIFRNARQFVS